MRRLVISLALLAALGGVGLWNSLALRSISQELLDTLAQAEAQAEAGNWAGAEALTRSAQERWESVSLYLYIVLRHDYTDEVNGSFASVLELIEWQETPEYAAGNGELMAQVEHFSEAEQLNWKNLL